MTVKKSIKPSVIKSATVKAGLKSADKIKNKKIVIIKKSIAKKLPKTPAIKSVSANTKTKAKPIVKATKKAQIKKLTNKNKPLTSTPVVKPAKKPARTSQKAITLSKKVSKKVSAETTFEEKLATEKVDLPTNMSQRSVEKTMVLNNEFFNNFQNSAFKIAYVSGLCFILVGLSYYGSNIFVYKSNHLLTADLINSGESTNVLPIKEPVILSSDIEVGTIIPNEIHNTYPVTITVTNSDNITIKLKKVGSEEVKALAFSRVSDNSYKFAVPGNELSPGFYFIRISAVPNGSSVPIFRETNKFEIKVDLPAEEIKLIEPVKEPVTEPIEETVIKPVKTLTPEETQVKVSDIISVGAVKEPVSNPEMVANNIDFKISSVAGELLSGTVTIKLSAPIEYSSVDLYLRPDNSLDVRHVTHVLGNSDSRKFIFDSTSIPDGRYQFFAQTKVGDKQIKSESISISIRNKSEPIISTSEEISESFVVSDIVSIKKPRDFADLVDAPPETATTFSDNVNKEVRLLINSKSSNIEVLLKRYAVAVQSGDESLIYSAKRALQDEKDRLITSTLQDPETRDFSDKMDERLQEKISNLQNRVDTFEQLRKDRTEGATAIDTDQDGISDFDEINLYGTDPKEADTDNDGFTDGAEIIRGYNPLSAESETIVKFESPQESIGLVRDEVLKVNEVFSIVKLQPEEGSSPVTAEIHGKSLPNSFVTLYIFSSPTVVTIKTDADGSFVYNFDKELEDGKHEIYAAITDNAGEIIAQSNPFSFIKEAQAFTPVDAASSEVVSSESATQSTKSSYGAVAGMGILALGLILIMLGITLRPKKEDENNQEEFYVDPTLPAGSPKISSRIEHIDAS